ncbi:MAG: RluA family pseudouridine synthase [Treponemataceae bacterium]|nr:RluA family pseudouridine synthase [Treponemataceae bacterium]
MEFAEFSAGADDDGRRLDRIVRRFLPEEPLSGVYKAIRKGLVRLDGRNVPPDARVRKGALISVAAFLLSAQKTVAPPPAGAVPADGAPPYPVVFRNDHLIVVNKPAGIAVHGGGSSTAATEPPMDERIAAYYRAVRSPGGSLSFTPGPLHRLDRSTSGLLAFSWSILGARWFSRALSEHQIRKFYLGIARGNMERPEAWRDFITKDDAAAPAPRFCTVAVSPRPTDGGAEAATRAVPLLHGSSGGVPYTLVRYEIETGRTHQIRAQSAAHGFPLLGDSAYGGGSAAGVRLFLHAARLEFPPDNPLSLPPALDAPPPEAFLRFLEETAPRGSLETLRNEEQAFIMESYGQSD